MVYNEQQQLTTSHTITTRAAQICVAIIFLLWFVHEWFCSPNWPVIGCLVITEHFLHIPYCKLLEITGAIKTIYTLNRRLYIGSTLVDYTHKQQLFKTCTAIIMITQLKKSTVHHIIAYHYYTTLQTHTHTYQLLNDIRIQSITK